METSRPASRSPASAAPTCRKSTEPMYESLVTLRRAHQLSARRASMTLCHGCDPRGAREWCGRWSKAHKSSRNGTWSAGACGHHPLRALCGQQQAHSCQRQDARDQSARPRRRRRAPWTWKYVQIWTTAVAAVLAIRALIGQVQLAAGGANSRQVQAGLDRVPQELA